MDRPGPEGCLTGRYQFRLDLRDPRQRTLAQQLEAMPKGQRNRVIVEKLLEPEKPAGAADIKTALREVLLEFSPSFQQPSPEQEPQTPDDLFDVKLFK